jgi:Gpi18-like mannosyltransferase
MKRILKKIEITHILFFIMIAFSLWMRIHVIEFKSLDYLNFLKPWMDAIIDNGQVRSLGTSIGNYSPSYVYILTLLSYFPSNNPTDPYLAGIKYVSIGFDFLLAFSVYLNATLLIKKQTKQLAFVAALIVFYLPSVLMNSSFWGQIDASYTAFALISLYYLQKDRPFQSAIWIAVSFAFKLQAIFFIPVFVMYFWFHYKNKIYYAFLIPIVFIVIALPTILFGRPWIEVMSIYVQQIDTYKYLTMNMPNLWSWFPNLYDTLSLVGFFLFSAVMGFTFLIFIIKKMIPQPKHILILALWSVMVANFLLPSMHERYLYAADILSLLVAIQFSYLFYLPILLQIISTLAYAPYLFQASVIPMKDLAVIHAVTLMFVSFYGTKILLTDSKDSL